MTTPQTLAYLRVSTDAQEQSSQRQQIDTWAATTGHTIAGWYSDKQSGATRWQDRALAPLLEQARAGDTIVVSEISRIARSTVGVLTFLQEAAAKNITVHAVQSRMTLDGSLQATITVTILALVAEIERELCRARTKAALADRRARGLPLGRQPGTRVRSKLDQHRSEINELLTKRVSKRAIARIVDCAPGSLYAWLKRDTLSTIDTRTLTLPGIEPPAPLPGTHPATAATIT